MVRIADIIVANRDEASGTRATFLELCLEQGGKEKFLDKAIITESHGDMVTKVGSTPNSIGYCGFGYLDKAKNAGGKAISVNGVDATVANVVKGTFPIFRSLFAVSNGPLKSGTVKK